MKKAKSVLLILSAIHSFLTAIGLIVLAVFSFLLRNAEATEQNAANSHMTVEDLQNLLQFLKILAIPSIILALISLFACVFALIANHKRKNGFYVGSIIIGVFNFNILMILGSIFGMVSIRNGDELTY